MSEMEGILVSKRDFLRIEEGDSTNNESNPRLPSKVPIVGLGCSSFSTFFMTKDELNETKSDNDGDSNITAEITADMLTKDHPKVKEWIKTIRYAIEKCGITLLDTAPWYGHGTSEMVVGWALEEILNGDNTKIARSDLCINTKVGRYEADPKEQFDFSRRKTLESAKTSLQRLSCGYIDVLQLHDPEFSPSLHILLDETIPALVECRSNGWCKALGLTGYPLEVQYQILQASLEKYGAEDSRRIWDQALTYGHFNLHDSSLVHRRVNPSCESFCDHVCRQNKMGLLAAAPLSMGLLTHNIPPEWHPANGSELGKACFAAASICSELRVNITTLALLFSMSHPNLPCTILGMKSVEEVRTAASLANRFKSVDWSLPGLTQDLVLSFVLTFQEQKAYQILKDAENGPFASVWRRTTETDYDGDSRIYSPQYQWDGIKEAHEFWKSMGAPFEDWQEKSFP